MMTEETKSRIRELRDSGYSYRQVADDLQMKLETIKSHSAGGSGRRPRRRIIRPEMSGKVNPRVMDSAGIVGNASFSFPERGRRHSAIKPAEVNTGQSTGKNFPITLPTRSHANATGRSE